MIEVYFQEISIVISKTAGVQSSCLTYDKRSSYIGFIRGSICFYDGSVLHLREFVNVQYGIERYMYAYHYQSPDGIMIFRYDNTPHFPNLTTFPHHKHEGSESNVTASVAKDIQAVLNEIRMNIKMS